MFEWLHFARHVSCADLLAVEMHDRAEILVGVGIDQALGGCAQRCWREFLEVFDVRDRDEPPTADRHLPGDR